MDLCHFKPRNLNQNSEVQKVESHFVEILWKTIQDHMRCSLNKAMTAAKDIDVIARLPDFDGQAADAISAFSQVSMEGAPKLLRIPKSECPVCMDTYSTTERWLKSWSNIQDPVVPLERNLYGHPLAGLLWERKFENFYWNWNRKKPICWKTARFIPISVCGRH